MRTLGATLLTEGTVLPAAWLQFALADARASHDAANEARRVYGKRAKRHMKI
jgi:hypothetical protein